MSNTTEKRTRAVELVDAVLLLRGVVEKRDHIAAEAMARLATEHGAEAVRDVLRRVGVLDLLEESIEQMRAEAADAIDEQAATAAGLVRIVDALAPTDGRRGDPRRA